MNFNPNELVTLVIIVALVSLVGTLMMHNRRPAAVAPPVAEPSVSSVSSVGLYLTDPAPPAVQDGAVGRLLRLPHIRRLVDGTLLDYYRGIRIETCQCQQFPYPHLVVCYGEQCNIALATASALEQYVAVQEAIGAWLDQGMTPRNTPVEGC